MTARPAQVLGIENQLTDIMLMDDLEAICARHLKTLDQSVMHPLG